MKILFEILFMSLSEEGKCGQHFVFNFKEFPEVCNFMCVESE